MHEEYYTFDSVLNQGMIPVNFDGCVNKLTKVITSCCNFSLVGLESTRKGKILRYYQPEVMRTEITYLVALYLEIELQLT